MKNITTIINYCTNDYIFLKPCIDAALKVSNKVIVPFCTHFHDGTEQDQSLLLRSANENPGAEFVQFDYYKGESSRWHCNASRKIGILLAPEETEYFMFLDTDEIIEPEKFIEWFNKEESQGEMADSYRLANYFYFRDFCYRAKEWEDSIALVKNNHNVRNDDIIFHNEERHAFYYYTSNHKRMCTLNGQPFIHHYSWVRTMEGMLKKVKTWSHRGDRDWASMVKQEFSENFRGTDVIFGKQYDTVEPYLKINLNQ